MALHQTPRTRLIHTLLAAVVVLALFGIASYHLTRESLAGDEGYSLWFIRDNSATPDSLSAGVRFVRDSLLNTLSFTRTSGVNPPLYYVTLDAWSLLTGESLYAVRLYSTLFGLIALAATYALGRRVLRDPVSAVLAVLILGTASFFVYYTREARMYTLLLALTTLSMWAYLRWSHTPTPRRTMIYGVLLALLLYTHYVSVLVLFTQLLHRLLWGRRNLRLFFPFIIAAALFAPWLPSLLAQYRIFGGPGGLPLPTDWNSIAALWVILTNGFGWLYVVLLITALVGLRRSIASQSLLWLWLLVLPVSLLLLNVLVRPVFQIRYTLPMLPAFALIVAPGIETLFSWSFLNSFRLLRFVLLLLVLFLQLATYSWFWPNKPDWETTILRMTQTRELLEPAITSIAAHNPTAYYDRLYAVRQGISLDLAWRWQETEAIRDYVARLRPSPAIWVVMPSSLASTWDAVTALMADGWRVGYRDTLMDMIFYRFDRTGDDLHFRFADVLAWTGGLGHEWYARVGELFCFELNLQTLQPINANYTLDVALTQGYNTRHVSQTIPLNAGAADTSIAVPVCLDIPPDILAGSHHLRLRVLYNDAPLVLLEGENLYWSEELFIALVTVA